MDAITVLHRDHDQFAILIRDHVLFVDQPYAAGGNDVGPTPVELFVSSLAACAAHDARRYLVRNGLPSEGIEVTAKFTMSADGPARVRRVQLRLRAPDGTPADHFPGLLRTIESCTLHNSLRQQFPIDVDVDFERIGQAA